MGVDLNQVRDGFGPLIAGQVTACDGAVDIRLLTEPVLVAAQDHFIGLEGIIQAVLETLAVGDIVGRFSGLALVAELAKILVEGLVRRGELTRKEVADAQVVVDHLHAGLHRGVGAVAQHLNQHHEVRDRLLEGALGELGQNGGAYLTGRIGG